MATAWVQMVVDSSSWCLSSFAFSPQRDTNAVRLEPTRILISSGRINLCSSMRTRTSFSSPSSNPQPEDDDESSTSNNNAFTSPEDLNYLWKLGAGSVGGAAVIKYGSILFPEITRPNIVRALIIISLPVIVAVLVLARQSRIDEQKKEPS